MAWTENSFTSLLSQDSKAENDMCGFEENGSSEQSVVDEAFKGSNWYLCGLAREGSLEKDEISTDVKEEEQEEEEEEGGWRARTTGVGGGGGDEFRRMGSLLPTVNGLGCL